MSKNTCFIMFLGILILFSSCASTAKIEFQGNQSVGDGWECTSISPEGVVREVSNKYRIYFPAPGMPGRFIFKFEAVSEGEAEIVLTHYFRGRETGARTYTAVVDNRSRLTLTEIGSTGVDMKSEILGKWYNDNRKIAVRFLEDVIQIARDVEDIETADFVNIGTYEAGRDAVWVTITSKSVNGDNVSYTEVIG